ncbi:MAG: hypothetical protein LBN12_08750 [Clostridiales Family XIII bacterium]|nr:hypothetical protein [Clostridiales Family XIII bacterium]
MKNISLCILNHDAGWAKAFLRAASLDHPGFSVTFRIGCCECTQEYDACLNLTGKDAVTCPCVSVPPCGKHGGATALLAAANAFAVLRNRGQAMTAGAFPVFLEAGKMDEARMVCVHARAGGMGASCVSIGIGREMARYRDVKSIYLCLTDRESPALLPESCAAAMPAEALLFRSLRLQNRDGKLGDPDDTSALSALIRAAVLPDEYGLLRLGVDQGLNALSSLTAQEALGLIGLMNKAVGPACFVLDFGTRGRLLDGFCEICDPIIFEVMREGRSEEVFATEDCLLFPECPEDIRRLGDRTDVALANAFGLKIKEICDTVLEA